MRFVGFLVFVLGCTSEAYECEDVGNNPVIPRCFCTDASDQPDLECCYEGCDEEDFTCGECLSDS